MTLATRERLFTVDFAIALVVTLIYFTAVGILQPELPRYVVGPLDGNGVAIGATMATFLVTACIFRSVAGTISIKYGNKIAVAVGSGIAAISILGYGAGGLGGLLVARAVTGIGEAIMYVGIAALILDLAPVDRAAEATSYFTVGLFGGFAVGAVVGEAISGNHGYTAVWIAAAVLCAVASLLIATVRAKHVVVVAPPEELVVRTRSQASLRRILQPDAIGPGVLFAVSMIGYSGFVSYLPLYVERVGMTSAGPVFAESAVIIIILRVAGAKVPAALGALRCSLASFVLQAGGWIMAGEWTTRTGLFAGVALASMGISLLYPALFTASVDRAPAAERGYAIGTFTMLCDVAVGLGAVVLGGVVTLSDGNEQRAFQAAFVVNLLCFVLLAVRRELVATTTRKARS
jgi:MFS family permease